MKSIKSIIYLQDNTSYILDDLFYNKYILSEEFAEKYKYKIDWKKALSSFQYEESFLNTFKGFLHWNIISKYNNLSDQFILENFYKLNLWKFLQSNKNISEVVLDKILEVYPSKKLNFNILLKRSKNFSERLFAKYKHKFLPDAVALTELCHKGNILTEDFFSKNENDLALSFIVKHIKMSELFIEKYSDKFDLGDWIHDISTSQILSETFLEKYQDKLNWPYISYYQKLSNKFIAKHLDKLQFYYLKLNKRVDQEFIERLELLK